MTDSKLAQGTELKRKIEVLTDTVAKLTDATQWGTDQLSLKSSTGNLVTVGLTGLDYSTVKAGLLTAANAQLSAAQTAYTAL